MKHAHVTRKIISFETPLIPAYMVKRDKRFFVHFIWEQSQDIITHENKTPLIAHTNNTGSMLGLLGKGRSILLSKASNPNRKLAWTLEAISAENSKKNAPASKHNSLSPSTQKNSTQKNVVQKTATQHNNATLQTQNTHSWIGVNTSMPNAFLQQLFHLQQEFLEENILPWAKEYNHIRMEAVNKESRLDALMTYIPQKLEQNKKAPKQQELEALATAKLWVECKSVTLVEDGVAAFPDAISARGTKHLETLMRILEEAKTTKEKTRAAMLYIIQRTDGTCFAPADYIDSLYSEKLFDAYQAGVEIYTVIADVRQDGIYHGGTLPLAPCFFGKN